jgi:hydrogenase small subunit
MRNRLIENDVSSQQRPEPIASIDVLFFTAGLSCDADTISMTAASQPSFEDLVLAIPWIPKVRLINPFLSYENGDELLALYHRAAEGKSGPFIFVMEGSVPDESNKQSGYWAAFGNDPATGQPIPTR